MTPLTELDCLTSVCSVDGADYKQSKRVGLLSLHLKVIVYADMPPSAAAEWRGKAGGFLSSSSESFFSN